MDFHNCRCYVFERLIYRGYSYKMWYYRSVVWRWYPLSISRRSLPSWNHSRQHLNIGTSTQFTRLGNSLKLTQLTVTLNAKCTDTKIAICKWNDKNIQVYLKIKNKQIKYFQQTKIEHQKLIRFVKIYTSRYKNK